MLRMTWLAATVIAAAAIGAWAVPVSAQAGQDPFTGVWVGVEVPVGDGSTDVMSISGANANGVRHFNYYETNASGYCGPGGGGPLTASGTATSAGDTLTVTFTSAKCANGQPGAFPPPFQATMTATGDGHIDWGGIIFSRAGAA